MKKFGGENFGNGKTIKQTSTVSYTHLFLINKAIVATRAPAQMSGSKVKSITCCKLYFENKACLKLILLLYNIGAAGCIIHSWPSDLNKFMDCTRKCKAGFSSGMSNSHLYPIFSRSVLKNFFLFGSLPNTEWRSVSYTHLDVYKRQTLSFTVIVAVAWWVQS